VAGLLLNTARAGDIDRQRRTPSSNGAAARHSAANAGSDSRVEAAEHRLVFANTYTKFIALLQRRRPTQADNGCCMLICYSNVCHNDGARALFYNGSTSANK